MDTVTVIICAYNEIKFVDECLTNLQNIRQNSYSNLAVIVKDQNSTDGTSTLIESKYPWVTLIKSENKGLAYAYNLGYRAAESEYLLFLGMDAFPTPETISGLVDYFKQNPTVGAATIKLVNADGNLDMDAHRAFPTPLISITRLLGLNKIFPNSKFFNGYFMPGEDMNKPHEIDLCISHFMFTRKSLLDKLGGFDERFFLYGEDVDICYRIKESGAKIMYLAQWTAKHMKGGSIGIRKTTRDLVKKPLAHRLKMQKLSAEAMELFVRKHYMKKYPTILCYGMIYSSRVLGVIRVVLESFR